MPVYKDEKKGTYIVRFKTKDIFGKVKEIHKRGFSTKKEALAWEANYKNTKKGSPNMTLESFVREIYFPATEPRVKLTTWDTKTRTINMHILPYFGHMKLNKISTAEIIGWQNQMMRIKNPRNNKLYARTFLEAINKELVAIFSFAVKYYGLKDNPAREVGLMCRKAKVEMKFWTLEQYKKFEEVMRKDPVLHLAFQILYWTGARKGEMMALQFSDIDLERGIMKVSKTFNHIAGRDIISTPKTASSNREINLPKFLIEEIKEYKKKSYKPNDEQRMFPISKSKLEVAFTKGIKEANLPKIRIHDLRHSHVSLLINNGFSALAIAKRVGHNAIQITYRYAHLFPTIQQQMAETLDDLDKHYIGSVEDGESH